jgi:AcrR family transcriptional regulator
MNDPGTRSGTNGIIPSAIKDETVLALRRAQVVAAATELFIERGFSSVSVNEIAAVANTSIGSLYKYIRAKEDILWLVMDSIYGKLEQMLTEERATAKDAEEALAFAFRRFLVAVDAVRRGVLLMYREYYNLPRDGQREFMRRERRIVDIFAEILREGNESGLFHCVDPETVAVTMLMAGHTWSIKGWMFRGESLDQFIARQTRLALVMAGCAPRHAARQDKAGPDGGGVAAAGGSRRRSL